MSLAPARRVDVAFALAWALIVLVGVALRVDALTHGVTTDEIGNVLVRRWGAAFFDPESGVNPPLWRWLGVPWATDRAAIQVGRGVAFVAGVLGMVVVGDAARRVGGRLSALAATLLMALGPTCVRDSALDRAYAAGALTLAVALWLSTLPIPRPRAALAAILLLPWWHYLLFPVAGVWLVMAQGTRLRARLIAGAVAWSPLVVPLFLGRGRREPQTDGWIAPTLDVLSGGLHPEPHLGSLVAAWGVESAQVIQGALLLGACALCGAAWPWLSAAARRAWLGALAVAAAVALGEQVHFVRSDAATFWWAPLAVVLGTVTARLPVWAHALALTGLGLGLFAQLPAEVSAQREQGARQDGLRELAAWWPGDTALVVHPAFVAGALWFERTGTSQTLARDRGGCVVAHGCYTDGEATWRGVDVLAPTPGAVVATLTPWVDDAAMAGCARVEDRPGWRAWRCPP